LKPLDFTTLRVWSQRVPTSLTNYPGILYVRILPFITLKKFLSLHLRQFCLFQFAVADGVVIVYSIDDEGSFQVTMSSKVAS
jgi:hypothetical protein